MKHAEQIQKLKALLKEAKEKHCLVGVDHYSKELREYTNTNRIAIVEEFFDEIFPREAEHAN